MKASLPPSSSTTGVSVAAAADSTVRPTPVLPTKITFPQHKTASEAYHDRMAREDITIMRTWSGMKIFTPGFTPRHGHREVTEQDGVDDKRSTLSNRCDRRV